MKTRENRFRSKTVVLDTETGWIYIGVLEDEDDRYYYLTDVDAFDISEVNMTKHEYLVKVKKDGLTVNRKKTIVSKEHVIGLTLLEDIIEN